MFLFLHYKLFCFLIVRGQIPETLKRDYSLHVVLGTMPTALYLYGTSLTSQSNCLLSFSLTKNITGFNVTRMMKDEVEGCRDSGLRMAQGCDGMGIN